MATTITVNGEMIEEKAWARCSSAIRKKCTKESGWEMFDQAKANSCYQMAKPLKDHGGIIKCKEMGNLLILNFKLNLKG